MVSRTVPILLAAALSAAIAGALGGCADPTAPLDVATTVAEDRPFGQVAEDAKIKLDFDRQLGTGSATSRLFFDVNCDVYEGRMMLTGSVKTQADRERAVSLARNISGVKVVYDDIQVTDAGGVGNTARDALIEAKIKAKLVGAKGIKSINFRWQSVNGTIYLIGRARSRSELDSVIAIIKDTEDVKAVVNHAEVGPDKA
jgi:osmotically-inducible protein OsmY